MPASNRLLLEVKSFDIVIPPSQVTDEGVSGAVPEFLFGNDVIGAMTSLPKVLTQAHAGAE